MTKKKLQMKKGEVFNIVDYKQMTEKVTNDKK